MGTKSNNGDPFSHDARIIILDLLEQLVLTTHHFVTHDSSCAAAASQRFRGCDCGADQLFDDNNALVKKTRQMLGLE